MMRKLATAILATGLAFSFASAASAHHKTDHSAPGQQAKADDAADVNGDGKINGKDDAPGQNKE